MTCTVYLSKRFQKDIQIKEWFGLNLILTIKFIYLTFPECENAELSAINFLY